MAPHSRLTIHAGGIPELVGHSFATRVRLSVAGTAERAMYFGSGRLQGGHAVAGVTRPLVSAEFAEGTTGSFFTTFLLLANPSATATRARVTYLPPSGPTITRTYSLAPLSRLTINVAQEDPTLAETSVGISVRGLALTDSDSRGRPLLAERAQYWSGPPTQWEDAHASAGVPGPPCRSVLTEGRVGGPEGYQTFILLANARPPRIALEYQAVSVQLTFLREGRSPLSRTVVVAPFSRVTVAPGVDGLVPELQNERFSTVVEGCVIAERSMYASTRALWSTGTNTKATWLPTVP